MHEFSININKYTFFKGETKQFQVPNDWTASRIWARTGCSNQNGRFVCDTGDCGQWVDCNNGNVPRTGVPPATLAEFTFAPTQDYYDVSNVDGFNIPVTIEVVNSNQPGNNGDPNYWCKNPSCKVDINKICPYEFQKKNSQGQVVACYTCKLIKYFIV